MTDYTALDAIRQLRVRLDNDQASADHGPRLRWNEVKEIESAIKRITDSIINWQAYFLFHASQPFTKWDLCTEVERETLESMLFHFMPADDYRHSRCPDCGEQFVNWADNVKHFVLPSPVADDKEPGTCWRKACPELAGTRPEWEKQ